MVEFKDQFSSPRFAKDQSEVEMLKSALERKDLDGGMAPILERFFSLPFTPWHTSCTGHIEKKVGGKTEITDSPHFSYTEDEVADVANKEIQNSFRERLPELEQNINSRYGQRVLEISCEFVDVGARSHQPYTILFSILERDIDGQRLLTIIWEEFFKYIDNFDKKDLPIPNFENGDVFIKVTKKD